jgi:hypothetical protein
MAKRLPDEQDEDTRLAGSCFRPRETEESLTRRCADLSTQEYASV